MRDMQVAGFAPESQRRYLTSVSGFFRDSWLEPLSVTERDVQDFLLLLRDKKVARETFRGYRYALQFFFVNTLGRDWALFKKKFRRRLASACPRRWSTRRAWSFWARCIRRYAVPSLG